jgi:hypothetical protein
MHHLIIIPFLPPIHHSISALVPPPHIPPVTNLAQKREYEVDLGLHSLNSILLQPLSGLNSAILRSFDLLACSELFLGGVVDDDAGDLDDAYEAEEEVDGCEPICISLDSNMASEI